MSFFENLIFSNSKITAFNLGIKLLFFTKYLSQITTKKNKKLIDFKFKICFNFIGF
ncbi:hypothetical protein SAMN06298216_4220 [Spirosomataceae bacterium TFI 002]|nr:hypothetical protein SAMN06298216_4220 [Spirosomataceae bacterium TFI 002]